MLEIIRSSKRRFITTTCFFLLVISALFYLSFLNNINEKPTTAWQTTTTTTTTTKRHLAPEEDVKYLSQVTVAKMEIGYDRSSVEEVELNKGSSLYKHIHSIVHNPELRRITVRLVPGSRCPQPSLMGRLSGKSLSIIEWDRTTFTTESGKPTAVTGHYSVPFSGQYYIEIIILYCKQINDETIAPDLRVKCLEIPDYHRLTELGATISAQPGSSGSSSSSPRSNVAIATANDGGYWESSIATPLYTRWQPQRCREENRAKEDRCARYTTLKPFEKYAFRWNDGAKSAVHVPLLKDVITTKADNYTHNCAVDPDDECRICTVGASHSRRLYRYLEAIRVRGVGYFLYKHPRDIDDYAAREIKAACPVILLGFGQWSASFDSRDPPLLFRDEMRDMLMQYFLPSSSSEYDNVDVHVTSVHLNPLGDIQTHCPTWDFRTPPVIERYNWYLKELCEDLGVSFIDAGFITKPMWDSAEDWNHLIEKVQIIEAQYYAGRFDLL